MVRRRFEEEEQKKVVAFCRKVNIPIWASASGIWCETPQFFSKLKALGIIATKGEPDLFIPVVKRKEGVIISGGLFIEMKKKGGKATKEQLSRVSFYNQNGYTARIIEGADKAIELIQEYCQ